MKQAYNIALFQCDTCKFALAGGNLLFTSLNELEAAVSQIHKDNKLICIKPSFVIIYNNVLVSNEILNTNGKVKGKFLDDLVNGVNKK